MLESHQNGIVLSVLSLIKNRDFITLKQTLERLFKEENSLDEQTLNTLYWMSEIYIFLNEYEEKQMNLDDHVRQIFPILLVSPERSYFLEMDSRYFSQFKMINEYAEEALLFKDVLMEQILELKETYAGFFEELFANVLALLTKKEEYFFVVQGNLSILSKDYFQAEKYYRMALDVNPDLYSANLNLLFVYALLKDTQKHEAHIERLLFLNAPKEPLYLSIANSYLLMDELSKSEQYARRLNGNIDWDKKIDFYLSTFCYEHGLYELALKYAKTAFELRPENHEVIFHYSCCLKALNKKPEALEVLKKLETRPDWMEYFRFTLLRDIGQTQAATETLMNLPREYFEEQEYDDAVSYARKQMDLSLLRHLRKRLT